MADLKISELASASTLTGSEIIEVVQGGVNKRSTVNAVINAASARQINKETPSGIVDGINADFTLTHSPITGTEHLYYNGMLIDGDGQDYTISGALISFNIPPEIGTKLSATYNY